MGNHFHLLLKENNDGGISKFMLRLQTGYSMYFNKKNERTGALFSGPFKSKHIGDEIYLQQVIKYIHVNPLEAIAPSLYIKNNFKDGVFVEEFDDEVKNKLLEYPYSSFPDFMKIKRPENDILSEGNPRSD